MYSDSDDDSQISQPHLADRPRLLDQTMEKEFTLSTDNTELVTSASASENLNRLVQSLSGASLTESLDSVSIGTRNERDDDKNRSPINRPQSMLTKMNKQQQYPSMETKFEDKALQTSPITSLSCLPHLIDQIEAHSSPSSSPRPFISRHLQNWADADLPQTENQYQARTQVKNRSFWARSRLQFQADEELFYKIKVLFPTLTKERIHELLYL